MTGKRKPWYRLRNLLLAFLAAALVLFGWGIREVLEVSRAQPKPTVDSQAKLRALSEEVAGVSADVGGDAWLLLIEILDAMEAATSEVNEQIKAGVFTPRDEYDFEVDYTRVLDGHTLPDDLAPERRALELMRNRGVFDSLARFAAGAPGIKPIRGHGQINAQEWLPALVRARELARVRTSSMRIALADGQPWEMVAAFDQTLALSRTISYQPLLFSYLVATATETRVLAELRYELIEARLDARTCRLLLESLDRQQHFAPIEFALEAERIYFHDLLQWIYTDDGNGDGYFAAGSLFGSTSARFFDPSRAEILNVYTGLMDQFVEMSRLRPVDLGSGLLDLDARIEALSPRYWMAKGAAIGKSVQTGSTRLVRLEGTRLMVAIEAYRARHGRYPDSLARLVPEILPSLPRDPLHGGAFLYRRVHDDPSSRPYLLYSTGLDQADDAGAALDEFGQDLGPRSLVNPALTGVDFVLNEPRPLWHE